MTYILELWRCNKGVQISSEQIIIPVGIDEQSLMPFIKMNIDGFIYDFSLDFSAEKSLVSEGVAHRIGDYGNVEKNTLHLPSVQCGIYNFDNVDFHIETQVDDVTYFDVFFGCDFFSCFNNVTLDFASNRIILNDSVANSDFIKYKQKDGFVFFNHNNLKIGMILMLIPNLYSNKFSDLPDTDLDLKDISAVSFRLPR